MSGMQKEAVAGVKIFEEKIFADNRGSNIKVFSTDYLTRWDITFLPVEVLLLHSNKNVIRGFHYQKEHPQSRLVTGVEGKLFVAIVDIDLQSETYGKSATYILTDKNQALFIPKSCALATCAIEDTDFVCMCGDNPFVAGCGAGIRWNDDRLAIEWPVNEAEIIVSEGDSHLPFIDFDRNISDKQ